jgi:hypothetical protein
MVRPPRRAEKPTTGPWRLRGHMQNFMLSASVAQSTSRAAQEAGSHLKPRVERLCCPARICTFAPNECSFGPSARRTRAQRCAARRELILIEEKRARCYPSKGLSSPFAEKARTAPSEPGGRMSGLSGRWTSPLAMLSFTPIPVFCQPGRRRAVWRGGWRRAGALVPWLDLAAGQSEGWRWRLFRLNSPLGAWRLALGY